MIPCYQVCDPFVTVYKGYSLRKETEDYLAAHGLRNAVYSIDAADARDGLFDDLVPCPFQVNDAMLYASITWQCFTLLINSITVVISRHDIHS